MHTINRLMAAVMLSCITATISAQSCAYPWLTVTESGPVTIQTLDKNSKFVDYTGSELRAGILRDSMNFVVEYRPAEVPEIVDSPLHTTFTNMYGHIEIDTADSTFIPDFMECFKYSDPDDTKYLQGFSVLRGGRYTFRTTCSGIGYDYSKVIEVIGDPIVRISRSQIGNTQDYHIVMHFNTGYPYDATQFTGNEKARATLYAIADGTATELASEEKQLSLCRPDQPLVAAVDSIEFSTITLTPGKYRVTVTSDWKLEDANSNFDFEVKDTETAIQPSPMAGADDKACYDLQGRKLPIGNTSKGLRIQSRRKILTK